MITLDTKAEQQIEAVLSSVCDTFLNDDSHSLYDDAKEALATIRAARAREQAELVPYEDMVKAVKEGVKQEPLMIIPEGGAFPFAVVGEIELAEQEPIGTYKNIADTMNSLWNGTSVQKQIAAELNNKLLYAAPVQQVDLTDDEERQIITATVEGVTTSELAMFKAVARAVIAADREKNK